MYDGDCQYAITRLEHTVVRLRGEPVFVDYLEEEGDTFHVRRLVNMEEVTCKLEELDLVPIPLGYVNFAGRASYVVRKPMRHDWRQGARTQNCTTLSGINITRIAFTEMVNTILNKFPAFEEAIKNARKGFSCAWHREWAVNGKLEVVYKGTKVVGTVIDNKVALKEQYLYLSEALAEAL